jgi:diguanylate cyclase (GGDEF)-like protein
MRRLQVQDLLAAAVRVPGTWFPRMAREAEPVQRESARQLAMRDFMSACSSMLGYGIQGLLLLQHVDDGSVLAWVLSMVLFEAMNGFAAWRLGRRVADPARRSSALRWLTLALFGSGTAWGCVALLPGLQHAGQAYLFNLLFLVAVGIFSVQNLCLWWPALVAFNLGLMWPMVYAGLAQSDAMFLTVQLIAGGLLVMVQIYGRTSRRLFLQGMRARLETEAIAEQLRRKNEELTRALESIEEMADLDPLTQCLNRRALMRHLQAPARHEQLGARFGIILLDLDHFKQINDRFGHGVGDNVLVATAARLRSQLRKQDHLARWGGEEFLCLMSDVDEVGLHAMAERLRSVLAEMPLLPKPKPLRVTASVGLALCGIGQNPDDVIEEADQAMYRAKRGGRNRVEGLAIAG